MQVRPRKIRRNESQVCLSPKGILRGEALAHVNAGLVHGTVYCRPVLELRSSVPHFGVHRIVHQSGFGLESKDAMQAIVMDQEADRRILVVVVLRHAYLDYLSGLILPLDS